MSILGSVGGKGNVYGQLLSAWNASQNRPPTLQELRLENFEDPDDIQYLGDLNAEAMSPTELRNILTDPRLAQGQYQTLDQLDEITAGGGLSAIDKAQLAEIQAQQASVEKGTREAIKNKMAAQGLLGSGSDLASQLVAQQEGANRASSQGLGVAAGAQDRMLNAGLQRAGLSASMQGADFARQATQAGAQDAINQFNTSNTNAARERNLNTRQNISGQNTQNRNQTSQMNTQNRNQATTYNVTQRPVQQYGMQTGQMNAVNAGVTGAGQAQAQQQQTQYAANAQLTGAGLQALGSVAGGFASKSDKSAKQDIEPASIDIEEFLQKLVPYNFKYKPGIGMDNSRHTGIMAQDLEKSEAGSHLVDRGEDGYKEVDLMKSIPVILASLGHLNKKIEERG
jgi:hypothetical protein